MTVDEQNEAIEKLKKIAYDEKKTIRFRDVEVEFGLNVVEVQNVLKRFVEDANNGGLQVTYLLSGYKYDDSNPDDLKLLRFLEVDEEELEERKKYFTQLNSCQIAAVRMRRESEEEEPVIPYATDPVTANDTSLLEKFQRLTCIRNHRITIRPNRLRYLLPEKAVVNEAKTFTKIKEPKVESTKENVCKTARKNGRGRRATKGKALFARADSKPKSLAEDSSSTFADKRTRDSGFESLGAESSQDMEVDPFSGGSDTEEVVTKIELQKEKERQKKEMEEHAKKQSTQKKRKRIRQISESSESEGETAEQILGRQDGPEEASRPTKAMVAKEITEEFQDEDGYTVTRKKKQMVEVPVSEDPKPKPKRKPKDEEAKEAPPKSKKANAKKPNLKSGQTSIVSFFKPAIKSA